MREDDICKVFCHWLIRCSALAIDTVTKFLEHSPENRCPLYVLYKIPLAQANFLLAQLKMHSHWRAEVSLTEIENNPWIALKQPCTKSIQATNTSNRNRINPFTPMVMSKFLFIPFS